MRLREAHNPNTPWKKWGPYLTERQWGTVREDYSQNGDAWNYFTHDQARSRAYHWGEDGLAGISDEEQLLCFALALWNGRDPILKERLFGLTNSEGNHGEDVKEYYFYLDSTPTHSYMKYLYKYPQAPFPYDDLVRTNGRRSRSEMEYELLDTGIFDEDRYFDVFVEYAKNTPEDILVQISVCNRGPEPATLHVLPTLWFRNTWTWWPGALKPALTQVSGVTGTRVAGRRALRIGRPLSVLRERCSAAVHGERDQQRADLRHAQCQARMSRTGSTTTWSPESRMRSTRSPSERKHPRITSSRWAPGRTATIWLRLTDQAPAAMVEPFGNQFAQIVQTRRREAEDFYRAITPDRLSADEARVMRQALSGMLWTKQYFGFDVDKWLDEHGADPMSPEARQMRNSQWFHMVNQHVISMPDKWEYPWYAAWDLAFHAIALSAVDIEFAKEQLDLLLQDFFLHPSGQIPAYEWNFSDVNPPVHAWATIFLYRTEQALHGEGDVDFLKRAFRKLMLNFTWWVNRKDRFGKNVFEGGFLGLDNIGVFDRSAPLPGGGHLEQADGTAWMALFCQNMLEIAVELAALRHELRGDGDEVHRPLPLDRQSHESRGARRHVGRRGRVLLRRAALPRRTLHEVEGPFHGGITAALRGHRGGTVAAGAGSTNGGNAAGAAAANAGTLRVHSSHRPRAPRCGRSRHHCRW